MSSQATSADKSWDFSACLAVLTGETDVPFTPATAPPSSVQNDMSAPIVGDVLSPAVTSSRNAVPAGKKTSVAKNMRKTASLGNFDSVFSYLKAEPIDIPTGPAGQSDTSSAESDALSSVLSYSTAASSPPEDDSETFDDFVRRNTKGSARKKNRKNFSKLDTQYESEDESDAICRDSQSKYVPTPSAKYLTPAWVTPMKVTETKTVETKTVSFQQETSFFDFPLGGFSFERPTIEPILRASRAKKQLRIAKRLISRFKESQQTIHKDILRSIADIGGNTHPDGIHVFVDSSNITIGFQDALKKARGIQRETSVQRPPISYLNLALIMERGRGVAKRVLVGSTVRDKRPAYMAEAQLCGYEVSALERVEKTKETNWDRHARYAGGYASNYASNSDSESPRETVRTMAEQGVDEILHMKMLESIVDADKPGCMVLATGDAAVAEYSAGFLEQVIRALKKGWTVELVCWKDSTSWAYKNSEFRKQWKGKFTIVELDEFQEELLDIYSDEPCFA